MRKINVNKSDVKKIYDEGKSIFSTNEILNKSQIFMKKIKDNLERMNTDIVGKEKEYNKRKKLCFKALATDIYIYIYIYIYIDIYGRYFFFFFFLPSSTFYFYLKTVIL
ncbi:hypothetical protein PFFVO_04785 [Plasmodium falciparum Vietnam Oak-Knoll (FVO)]|uniref:Uncharacterized protein n=1 Tax=Plasmodium falciparum Vietnam Oak-Knoll (FVO) TaxID=1036723 RepID=A0A024V0B0_PLAFA|nr:hypothetical protein PFFVO_04785 [Plasmodium falciparum Vietnam Oak-Knoll (FVO)]